jgi:hypothetical protein
MSIIFSNPSFAPRAPFLRRAFFIFMARVRRLIDRRVALEIARRERQAARGALCRRATGS